MLRASEPEGRRAMTTKNRIEMSPRGTRIPVKLIPPKPEEGATETDLLDAYP
jgi:hypothetical protein